MFVIDMLPSRESCFLNDDSETYYFSPSAKVQLNDLYEDQEVEYFHNPMLRCYCDNVGTKIWGLCHPALLPHPIICPPLSQPMICSSQGTIPIPTRLLAPPIIKTTSDELIEKNITAVGGQSQLQSIQQCSSSVV